MGGQATRRAILDATIGVIETSGEGAVRVADVARRAGVTQGMVTYHFRTRHQLVFEAQCERYLTNLTTDSAYLMSVVDQIHTTDDLVAVTRPLMHMVVAMRFPARRARLNAIGFVAATDETWQAMRPTVTTAVDEFAEFLTALQQRGILRPDVSPRAAAIAIQSMSNGFVQFDLDDHAPPADQVVDVFEHFVRSICVSPA